ncbi:barrier-to-autointegration factor-like [Sebastes fasciatus]|uniref:barrier-to-autointegration factor-like n=1 Tax=Sebastes fasciatus TaxID=394691 RepID=UPI003D9F71D4
MSSTSQKHREFVKEPMGNKSVTFLPGIGKVLGRRLEQQGFEQANTVLGQHLVRNKDPESFTKWLKDTSGANSRQAGSCDQCLREWRDNNL